VGKGQGVGGREHGGGKSVTGISWVKAFGEGVGLACGVVLTPAKMEDLSHKVHGIGCGGGRFGSTQPPRSQKLGALLTFVNHNW